MSTSGAVEVTVNGAPAQLVAGSTIADVVARFCASDRGVAVAVDRQVVPRSAWAATTVGSGAAVEIVAAAAGG